MLNPLEGERTHPMTSSLITIHHDNDGILVVHMHDKEGNNALGHHFIDHLYQILAQVAADESAKVCIFRGLPEVFCAGGDQQMLVELAEGKIAPTDILLSRAILELPIPTIAAMEGHAVGGGLTLGLCCDMVLLARESRYGCSFMNMGFTPGMGTTRLLQDAVGEYIAAEMMLGGQFFRGSHFEQRSLFNAVLPRDQVWNKAIEMASRIAEKPRFALQLLKNNLSLRKRLAFEEARTSEAAMHQISFSQKETLSLIRENYAPAHTR